MDLLLLTGRFPQRSETFIYRKAVALARRGHQVTVAARGLGDWSLYPAPLPPTMRVLELPPDHTLRAPRRALAAATSALGAMIRTPREARQLFTRVRAEAPAPYRTWLRHASLLAERPQVAHLEFLGFGPMYQLVTDVTRAPVVISCRGQDIHMLEHRPPAQQAAMLEALRRADAVHCVSDEIARTVARLVGRRDAVWVNRPAVDTDRIRPRGDGLASGPLRIVTSGRLVWVKGFEYLLSALVRVARAGVEFRAEILGEGEMRPYLRYSIDDLGLGDRVRLVGAVTPDEVLDRMRSADVFVLSSVAEGISNAALEAMAAGLPIVTTAAGGMAEAVTDGVDGIVVPVRDPDALADGILRLARDHELRRAMGRAARTKVEREFSLDRQVATFEAMYRAVGRPS